MNQTVALESLDVLREKAAMLDWLCTQMKGVGLAVDGLSLYRLPGYTLRFRARTPLEAVRQAWESQPAIVKHGDQQYVFDPQETNPATVELVSTACDGHVLIYEYELSGAHRGGAICVRVFDVSEDYDEAGWSPTFRRLEWADTKEEIHSAHLCDFYTDAILADIREQFSARV